MYCPNCNEEYDGKFCPECGTKLIEKPSAASGASINLGDANAISGGIHMSDSHNVHHEDRSVHNITNTTSTVNNVTNVAAQKTEYELQQERKAMYLTACKRAYEDNVLEQHEVVELEDLRIKLSLDKATANSILEEVRVMSERNARKTVLNPIARTKLKILTSNLQKNEVRALMDQIDSLEPLVRKFDYDELSRKYFLVLAALKSEKCVEMYETTLIDSYWKSFWSYLAYIKQGQLAKAEDVLISLDRFSDYPEDNMSVLAVAGALMTGNALEAKEYLNELTGEYTPALQRFIDSLYLLLEPNTAKEMGADENTCAFYLVNFFGQKDPKAKAEEERQRIEAQKQAEAARKAREEAERKAKEEAAGKAREEAERKAKEAAARKAREEAERKAMAEAIRKAREEAERKAKAEATHKAEVENSAFDVILKAPGVNKLQVIKRIKYLTGYGLKDAKEMVNRAPCTMKEGLTKAEAEGMKSELEGLGAVVELQSVGGEELHEETSSCSTDVILKAPGVNKLQVIKRIKYLTGYGLKEAKDMVDRAPCTVKEGLTKAEAEGMKSELEGLGAEVELHGRVAREEALSSISNKELADAVAEGLRKKAEEGMKRQAEEKRRAAEEKTSFDVVLKAAGPQKLQVIKKVKELTGLGLKEAKDLVDGAPCTVKEGLTKAEAEGMKSELEVFGAEVELH